VHGQEQMQMSVAGEPWCFKSVQLTSVDFRRMYVYLFSYKDRRGDIFFPRCGQPTVYNNIILEKSL